MKKSMMAILLAGVMAFTPVSVVSANSDPGRYELDETNDILTIRMDLDGNLPWQINPVISGESVELLTSEMTPSGWVGSFIPSGADAGYTQLEIMASLDDLVRCWYKVKVWVPENRAGMEVTEAYSWADYDDPGTDDGGDVIDPTDFDDPDFANYTAYVTADSLNVRDGNGTGYDVRATLKKGDEVLVTGMTGGWAMIVKGDVVGYASADYLSKTKPGTEQKKDDKAEEKEPWFEISEDKGVISVKLPADLENDMAWTYELTNDGQDDLLELVTEETVGDDADEKEDEPYWAASFRVLPVESGEVCLSLNKVKKDEKDAEEAPVYGSYDLDLKVADGAITEVVSAEEFWLEVEPVKGVLTVRLPGNMDKEYTWSYFEDGNTVAELLTQNYETKKMDLEKWDGIWAASFRGLSEGETTLTFLYETKDGQLLREKTVKIAVDALGFITVNEYTDRTLDAEA